MPALVLLPMKVSVVMNTSARIAPRLIGIGSFLCVVGFAAIGLHEWRASRQCTAAWDQAGERVGDYLTDRAATPYLGMMLASKHEVPATYRIAMRDFVSACRSGAIWQVVMRDEAGVYLRATPIRGGQTASLH